MDILMREESNGNRSMLTLMKELSTKYGKDKPFDDDTIIDEIVAMTYPSIGDFLNTHVIGSTPIDYSQFLEKVGLTFAEINYETNYIQAGNRFIFDVDQENEKIFFSQNVSDNTFWAEQNVQSGDIIKSLNGTILNLTNARSLMRQMYQWKVGDDMEMVITRNGEDITIKTTLTPAYTIIKNVVENPEATEAQIAIRNAWLKG